MNRSDQTLRDALRGYSAKIAASHPLPPSSLAWLRAERRRRRLAVERAERPLRIMQALGLVCAAIAAGWLLVQAGSVRPLPSFGTTVLVSAFASLLLVVAGCWTMLLASRRSL
jgi:sugar phosphate isomerase/epimerase